MSRISGGFESRLRQEKLVRNTGLRVNAVSVQEIEIWHGNLALKGAIFELYFPCYFWDSFFDEFLVLRLGT